MNNKGCMFPKTPFTRLLLSGFALLCFSCSSPAPAAAPKIDAAQKAQIEARLIGELSPTTDRAGRERNAIINRAIDQSYDVTAAPEGYFYEILDAGAYTPLTEGDIVTVHYRGNFLDGTEFDNSRKRGKPLRFRLGSLIPVWNMGLLKAKPGGSIRLLSPSALAYGADGLLGAGGDTLVPANTVLEFLIEDIRIYEE